MRKPKEVLDRLQAGVVNTARIHFVLVLLVAAQIIVYDAWDLITPESVLRRWAATALLLTAVTVVWYLARVLTKRSVKLYTWLVFGLIMADIAFASFSVYTQRGMASRAVALYAVPIIASTILLSRSAIFATATLSLAAYVVTAVSYFVLNFNEGYKVELYGEVGFYAAFFVVLASLMWTLIKPRK